MPKKPSTKPMFIEVADALKLVGTISRGAKTLHANIQTAAAAAIYHSNFHKNADVGIRLVEAILQTKGVRKNALVAYLEVHGNFKFDADKKAIAYHRNLEAECKDEQKLAMTLMQNPWDQAKPEAPIVSEYDMDKDLDLVIKRVQKAIKEGKGVSTCNNGLYALVFAAAGGKALVEAETPAQ